MFYNTVFALPVSLVIILFNLETDLYPVMKYEYWSSIGFVIFYIASSLMGFVLNFTIVHCTKVNSALTTAVVGSLKNILSTYLGMFFGDYIFTVTNFLGLNISVIGSMMYSYIKYDEQQQQRKKRVPSSSTNQISGESIEMNTHNNKPIIV